MRSENHTYKPIKFLEELQGNNHLVLLYDQPKYGDMTIAKYLQIGLNRGESCVYVTFEDPREIEERLSSEGLDVNGYKQENLLRIYHLEKLDVNESNAFDYLNSILNESTKGMKPPFRFVGRTVPNVESKEGIQLELIQEKLFHENFEKNNFSYMCQYDISQIEESKRQDWIQELLKTHHHVVYASEPEKSVGFETRLLESGE